MPQWLGAVMVLLSATAFGALPILAKLGYATGLAIEQMLAFRFMFAAAGMAGIALVSGRNSFGLGRHKGLVLFTMGSAYGAQSFLFFAALRSLPASLVELFLYTYPLLVAIGAWLFYGRRLTLRYILALVVGFSGVLMLIGDVGFGLSPELGWVVAAPVGYAAYLLVGERVMRETPALPASTIIMLGAAVTWTVVAAWNGQLRIPPNGEAWQVLIALAIGPSMLAITLVLAALPIIGGEKVAILSTWEPVVAVLLAFAILGERLDITQLLGGALVLVSVLTVQWPNRLSEPSGGESP